MGCIKLIIKIIRKLFRISKYIIGSIIDFCYFSFFNFHEVFDNTVLITEINDCHLECLPGHITYFLVLGFNVDVLITKDSVKQKPLCRIDSDKVHVFTCNTRGIIKRILNSKKSKNYEYIFVNSYIIYERALVPCDDYIAFASPKKKILFQEHHVDIIRRELISKKQVFVIADLPYNFLSEKPLAVCPLDFGKIKKHVKNQCTTFIAVGVIKGKERRNKDILLKICERLHNRYDFKIIICSREDVPSNPFFAQYPGHFEVYHNPDFEKLYDLIEDADFFLPLLDDSIEEHRRYVQTGTSGSFQLIYGFEKVPIIQEYFAKPHKYTDKNSLIYSSYEELADLSEKACKMSENEYEKYRSSLEKLKQDIRNKSISNIKIAMN